MTRYVGLGRGGNETRPGLGARDQHLEPAVRPLYYYVSSNQATDTKPTNTTGQPTPISQRDHDV